MHKILNEFVLKKVISNDNFLWQQLQYHNTYIQTDIILSKVELEFDSKIKISNFQGKMSNFKRK